ncbi:MAG TPA: hypothetical protein VEW26_04425, partial [Allosphingosinicella sp.]|nr:hypothetical protein [Allosphingosinicella sp.]
MDSGLAPVRKRAMISGSGGIRMSSSRIEYRCAVRLIGALALLAVLFVGPASASGPSSSPEDRQRLVSIARSHEQAPLNPALAADRAWALEFLTAAPDIEVTVCTETLAGLFKSKYAYSGQIVFQNMFSMAAFLIEHPEAAGDP